VTDSSLAGSTPAISEVNPDSLAAWLAARGEPAYRSGQLLTGAHRPTVAGFDDLTDLPASLRAALEGSFRFSTIGASQALVADGGLTA
jgi:adenine C2-methylase RlmN of 23S rRNA A2503 and tRNA A37